MTAESPLLGTADYRARALATQASVGVGTVRAPFAWNQVENPPGTYRFDVYDELVREAARNGLRVLPFVWAPPSAYVDRPPGCLVHDVYPPRDNNDYANFLAVLIARYGPSGTFWAQNPIDPAAAHPRLADLERAPPALLLGRALRRRPVRRAAEGGRGAHPRWPTPAPRWSARASPTAACRVRSRSTRFYQRMYDAGAKGSFDLAAVHPYATEVTDALALVDGVRALMNVKRRRRRHVGHRDGLGLRRALRTASTWARPARPPA